MTNAFFEPRILLNVQMQTLHQHIKIASLVTQIHSNAQGVIQNYHRHSQRNGESAAGQTFQIADGDNQRNGKGTVRRWHMSMGEKIFPLEAVLESEDDEFGGLGDDADNDRNEGDEIGI